MGLDFGRQIYAILSPQKALSKNFKPIRIFSFFNRLVNLCPIYLDSFAIMYVALFAIGLLALAFAGLAIKILLKKNGSFSGTCASNSPYLNDEGKPCSFCGALPAEQCKKEE
jgi:hypothetical protein